MCGFLGIDLFGSKKAAKIQAEATTKAAHLQAASDREVARAAVQSMSTQIAQKQASEAAAELIGKPQKGPTVVLSPQADEGSTDPATGRRRSSRAAFFRNSSVGASI